MSAPNTTSLPRVSDSSSANKQTKEDLVPRQLFPHALTSNSPPPHEQQAATLTHPDQPCTIPTNSVGSEASSSSDLPGPCVLKSSSRRYRVRVRVAGSKSGGVKEVKPKLTERRLRLTELGKQCCSKGCIGNFIINDIMKTRADICTMNNEKSMMQLKDVLKSFHEEAMAKQQVKKEGKDSSQPPSPSSSSSSKRTWSQLTYKCHGKEVCREAFRIIHGYSVYQMHKAIQMARNGVFGRVSGHAFEKSTRVSESTKWMLTWMDNYFRSHCDTTSNDDDPNGKGHWYMPSYLNLKDAYREMELEFNWWQDNLYEASLAKAKDDMPGFERSPHKRLKTPSAAHFYEMHKKHFSHVVEPTHSTYGVCAICLNLGSQKASLLSKGVTNAAELHNLYAQIRAHRQSFLNARKQMDERIMHGRANPHEVLYLGVDYTVDFEVPSFRPHLHMHDSRGKMEVKTGGVINFSTGTNFVFGHWAHCIPKNANAELTVLWHIIRAAKKSDHPCAGARKLQLQLDGGSENTEHTMYAFVAMLIEAGWFDVVEIYRLPVGHTHCIIDQRFAPLARLRKEKPCYSLFTFFREIPRAWNDVEQRPRMIWLADNVVDFKSYLVSETDDIVGWSKIKNIKYMRQLRFTKARVRSAWLDPSNECQPTQSYEVGIFYNDTPELSQMKGKWIGEDNKLQGDKDCYAIRAWKGMAPDLHAHVPVQRARPFTFKQTDMQREEEQGEGEGEGQEQEANEQEQGNSTIKRKRRGKKDESVGSLLSAVKSNLFFMLSSRRQNELSDLKKDYYKKHKKHMFVSLDEFTDNEGEEMGDRRTQERRLLLRHVKDGLDHGLVWAPIEGDIDALPLYLKLLGTLTLSSLTWREQVSDSVEEKSDSVCVHLLQDKEWQDGHFWRIIPAPPRRQTAAGEVATIRASYGEMFGRHIEHTEVAQVMEGQQLRYTISSSLNSFMAQLRAIKNTANKQNNQGLQNQAKEYEQQLQQNMQKDKLAHEQVRLLMAQLRGSLYGNTNSRTKKKETEKRGKKGKEGDKKEDRKGRREKNERQKKEKVMREKEKEEGEGKDEAGEAALESFDVCPSTPPRSVVVPKQKPPSLLEVKSSLPPSTRKRKKRLASDDDSDCSESYFSEHSENDLPMIHSDQEEEQPLPDRPVTRARRKKEQEEVQVTTSASHSTLSSSPCPSPSRSLPPSPSHLSLFSSSSFPSSSPSPSPSHSSLFSCSSSSSSNVPALSIQSSSFEVESSLSTLSPASLHVQPHESEEKSNSKQIQGEGQMKEELQNSISTTIQNKATRRSTRKRKAAESPVREQEIGEEQREKEGENKSKRTGRGTGAVVETRASGKARTRARAKRRGGEAEAEAEERACSISPIVVRAGKRWTAVRAAARISYQCSRFENQDRGERYEVERVLCYSQEKRRYLVQWKGGWKQKYTWEPSEHLKKAPEKTELPTEHQFFKQLQEEGENELALKIKSQAEHVQSDSDDNTPLIQRTNKH